MQIATVEDPSGTAEEASGGSAVEDTDESPDQSSDSTTSESSGTEEDASGGAEAEETPEQSSDSTSDTSSTDGDSATVYYAKFVDADLLTTQCYVSLDSGVYYWRFVLAVDSLKYDSAGFDTNDIALDSVVYYYYLTINNDTTVRITSDGLQESPNVKIAPSDFSSVGKYLATASGADTSGTLSSVDIVPYWVTIDGTKVYGTETLFYYVYGDSASASASLVSSPVMYGTDSALGVSSDSSLSVPVTSFTGENTSVLYVGVDITDISTYYTTENYPTTAKTYTEDGEEHTYIFAGWYEDDSGETACDSVPYVESTSDDGDSDSGDNSSDEDESVTIADIYNVTVMQSYLLAVIAFGVFLACGVLLAKAFWDRLK